MCIQIGFVEIEILGEETETETWGEEIETETETETGTGTETGTEIVLEIVGDRLDASRGIVPLRETGVIATSPLERLAMLTSMPLLPKMWLSTMVSA
mmetsp:Transcript_11538/g.22159  ORF Transcript_11538/g.22159 Transcript_11538/m.22159 type:complete len:97 (-) Transcript_11538:114-404(-)